MNRDIFILSGGRMKRKDNTLYFENEEGERRPIPVEQTNSIHFFGQVDFNTSLLHLLSQHQICFHVYNHYGYYDGSFCPRNPKVSGFTVVQQSAHVLDAEKRMYLAKSFVLAGIHHMLRNIRKNDQSGSPHIDTIMSVVHRVESAGTIPELMGAEGQGRQIYYNAFNQLLKNGMEWHSRSKQPPRDPINAMISFGNSLMYTTVISEIYKTVLDPTVSFLHEPSSRRFSLSLDIAEIFKPLIVDPLVLTLLNNRQIQEKHFDSKDGAVLLNDEGRIKFLSAFDEKMKTTIKHRKLKRQVSYRYLIRLEAYKLIKHLIGDEVYKPFKAWW
ncbi:CRISPR-associated endonuclease Cas1 [Sporotomaculum syntrophicum]|uniref:CRISPR-associated endonuclease Cas1 n=1 Tax=Sporotomaculum syntrophicum TaxID=182264 RepID=A0A9D2WLS3_9FIRM|nr:type I-B CRISPR-associated endonuclease Cas1b [Sporotomaculum syntrophicum]KAF1083730.1 CRISPR-associated endonuclease Cas1 [Sporotomaculum syntrophicum]